MAARDGRTPAAGTRLTGQTNRVTIQGIVAHHGVRRGLAPTTWRRATVVVSQDGLLELLCAAPRGSTFKRGRQLRRVPVVADALTGYRVDLQTDIVPASADKQIQPLAQLSSRVIDAPDFGERDWPGVKFDRPVPSHYHTEERVRLTGRATAAGPSNADTILVRFWKSGGDDSDALRFWGTVNPDGRFTVDVEPTALREGTYSLAVFLFWPDSGAQSPRGIMSPAVIHSGQTPGSKSLQWTRDLPARAGRPPQLRPCVE